MPVALHLDHGKSLAAVEAALAADFTSIMIDASEEPLAENTAISATARRMCGASIALEAELGSIGGKEDDVAPEFASTTDPAQVSDFVAPSAATCSRCRWATCTGMRRTRASIFDLLERVRAASSVPLVIHGGSGLPEEQLGRLADFGVVKVNVASDLRNAMIRSFGEAYAANPNENSSSGFPRRVAAISEVVERRIRMLNPSL